MDEDGRVPTDCRNTELSYDISSLSGEVRWKIGEDWRMNGGKGVTIYVQVTFQKFGCED